MYKVLYTDEATKQISKFDNKLKEKIRIAVEEVQANPSVGKSLTRELKGRFSYRIGDYRIIYRVYQTEIVVLILAVGHRKNIYERQKRKES